jgi:hypothetical protein
MPTRPAKLRDCCLLTRVWIPTAGTPRGLNEIAGLFAALGQLGRAAPAARILKDFWRGRDKLPRTLARTISLRTRHCLARLQQKSKPRNGAREIFVVTRGEITRALRLCRELDSPTRQEHAQNGPKIDAAQRDKTTTLSIS